MERATITQLKNGLSAYIDRVKAGEYVIVTDRGIPVAVLEPVTEQVDWDERMARLERQGVIWRATGKVPLDALRVPGPKPKDGSSVVEALLEERRSGW
jgi:prevent-host-death family protein